MDSEPKAAPIRVRIVDDHEVVRFGIRTVLEQGGDLGNTPVRLAGRKPR